MARTSVAAVILCAIAACAGAQVMTEAQTVVDAFPTEEAVSELASLTEQYRAGDWIALQRSCRSIIGRVAKIAPDGAASLLNVKRDYVAVMWVDADPLGDARLMRVVVHDPTPELFSSDLSGGALYELLLARTEAGRFTSVYSSTRDKNPIEDLRPAFAQAVAGPMFAAFAAQAGPLYADKGPGGTAQGPSTPTLCATIKRVALPFERATVKLNAVASDPWFDADGVAADAADLAARIRFEDVPLSECGREHAEKLAEHLGALVKKCGGKNLAECQILLDEGLGTAYKESLDACAGKGAPSASDLQALRKVDERFRAFLTSSLTSMTNVELGQTFHIRPLTRMTFGAGSAVLLSARLSQPRVTLEDGKLVADPLSRAVAMVHVNWTPWGYREDAPRRSWAERVRVQIGTALTPNFGPVLGVNLLLARGIGVSGGLAVLFLKSARPEEIGAAPANPKDPYRLGIATAPYVGITYNFK